MDEVGHARSVEAHFAESRFPCCPTQSARRRIRPDAPRSSPAMLVNDHRAPFLQTHIPEREAIAAARDDLAIYALLHTAAKNTPVPGSRTVSQPAFHDSHRCRRHTMQAHNLVAMGQQRQSFQIAALLSHTAILGKAPLREPHGFSHLIPFGRITYNNFFNFGSILDGAQNVERFDIRLPCNSIPSIRL